MTERKASYTVPGGGRGGTITPPQLWMESIVTERRPDLERHFLEWLSESLGREVEDPEELTWDELMNVAWGVFLAIGVDWRRTANSILNSLARPGAEGHTELTARVKLVDLGGNNGSGPPA